MMCQRCQADNREGRRFCAACGASLSAACPACGFTNEPGEKFCEVMRQFVHTGVPPPPPGRGVTPD